jgi:predicted thioredoxin/glutaredoxin
MKITKTKLVEIIKEELDAVLEEEEFSGEERTEKLSDEEKDLLKILSDEEKKKFEKWLKKICDEAQKKFLDELFAAWEERYVLELNGIDEDDENRFVEAQKKADEYIIEIIRNSS